MLWSCLQQVNADVATELLMQLYVEDPEAASQLEMLRVLVMPGPLAQNAARSWRMLQSKFNPELKLQAEFKLESKLEPERLEDVLHLLGDRKALSQRVQLKLFPPPEKTEAAAQAGAEAGAELDSW